ncbi:nucleotide-diphospho-sugar transferase [Mucilaginibacter sp. HD30]
MLSTPILLLLFNRPEATAQVFDQIRSHKPKKLFIAADGPRQDNAEDAVNCRLAREAVETIDWDCEVATLYHDVNLGCGRAPATAITWFFNHVDAGIILEDDCLPNDSFFGYCEMLLDKYTNEPQVMMICGTSYQPKALTSDSYYFSRYPHAWGWATWKRAWANYSFELIKDGEVERLAALGKVFTTRREVRLWRNNLRMIDNGLDAWDYQWMYWMWKNNGVCIVPWKNMVANIGFGQNATHTTDQYSVQSKMQRYDLTEIRHPTAIAVNKQADKYERYHILLDPTLRFYTNRIKHIVKRVIEKLSGKK